MPTNRTAGPAKSRRGMGAPPLPFDGRKARSAVKWKLLGILLGRVAAPVAAAELYEFFRRVGSRTIGEWAYRVRHPSYIYTYLYRMAEEGLVALDRHGDRLDALLTDRGRVELQRYSDYWAQRGIREPEKVDPIRRGSGLSSPRRRASAPATARDVRSPATAEASEAKSPEQASATQPSPAAGGAERDRANKDAPVRRKGPGFLAETVRNRIRRRGATRNRAGFGGGLGFVSYDLPMGEHPRRKQLLAVLRAAEYAPVHASMYAGPGHALAAVVQTIEEAGMLPHLRWGSLRLFNR